MKDKTVKVWIPLYVDKWIFGSTRIELEPAERAVFIDILAFGAKDNGFIRANETTPYHHTQLAGLLNLPVELLQSTIAKCIHFGKLAEGPPGIYKLRNWDEYQLTPRHKRRFDDMSPKADIVSPKADPIVKESRVEESRVEERKIEDTPSSLPANGGEASPVKGEKPAPETPLHKIVYYYKFSQGMEEHNKAWDKAHYARNAKAAKEILSCFPTVEEALAFTRDRLGALMEWREKGEGRRFSLEMVVRDAKVEREEAELKEHNKIKREESNATRGMVRSAVDTCYGPNRKPVDGLTPIGEAAAGIFGKKAG